MIVIIDNYDSFTYNIVQTIADLVRDDDHPEEVCVVRNDKITLDELERLAPRRLIISPGPCTPKEAGISISVINRFTGSIPILGICLGHQAIGDAFGGEVVRAERIMHGKTSPIFHDGRGVFTGLPNPFDGMRYHSLVVRDQGLPDCLEVTARTDQQEMMGLRHRTETVEGVQFHPESIMTPDGRYLLHNFLDVNYPALLGHR
ncbi:MAG: aminodeoxychorismate/anthranilate synthase component II [Desulfofustis sp.]|jgi:anthranilate synthase/aminodeoxychorismate synthase-like glutamine amidotransferase|nr:aminodeoxychorismate/anthranilate synthase component II [Desulfofustis sp.]